MTFVPGDTGVGMARLLAVQEFIVANLADLNTCMTANSITRPLPTNYHPLPINNTTCVIGDIDGTWDIKEGYLKIAVCPGKMRNGLDGTFERRYINMGSGITEKRCTDIYVIFHDAAFNGETSTTQRLLRVTCIETVSDWLIYGCLNRGGPVKANDVYLPITTRGAGQMPLTSRVYQNNTTPQTFDELQMCLVTSVLKGYFIKGPANGGRAFWGVYATHESQIL